MAATGYTPISLYYSTTASAVPTAGNLANGELALNIADMKLYAKNGSGVVTLLASNASTAAGVDSLSFGSTGLTPSTATTGAITVAGTLNVANGGTGLTSLTANRIPYGNGTSAFQSSSALTFDGTNLIVSATNAIYQAIGTTGWSGYSITKTNGSLTFALDDGVTFGQADGSAIIRNATGKGLYYYNSTTLRLAVNSTGNLGLAIVPSAWDTGGNMQLSTLTLAGNDYSIGSNYYQAAGNYKYVAAASTPSARLSFYGGAFTFLQAGAGTAGNNISSTTAMTLDASNNLLVGTTSNPSSSRVMIGNGTPSAASTTQHIGWGDGTKTTLMQQTGSSYSYAGVGANAMWWYLNSNWSALTIGSDGAVPITFVSNGAERTRISTTGGFSVGTTADPGAGGIYATGAITAYYSDERLKDVKGRIQNALAKVRRLSGVYYTNNETAKALGYTSDEMQVGVLANQMKGELPEIVKPAPFDLDEKGNSKSGENYMTVQYERGLPLIIEAIKELADTVDALAAR